MSEPFLGEIRLFGFGYNPKNWRLCDGSLLAIQSNTALFSVIGIRFGGNGTTNFQLPDLRGRAAIGVGRGNGLTAQVIGQVGGQPNVALTSAQIPLHNHVLNSGTLNPPNPQQNVASPTPEALLGLSAPNNVYIDPVTPDTSFIPSAISPNTGDQPHENMQPYVAMNFCIAWVGVYPQRN
jgi:microcystin-dependent protein